MRGAPDEPELADALPKAKVRRRRRFPVVWIVPVVAAIVAGYLVYGRFQEFGPTITIKFKDASGVRAGQTELRYRGVPIGQVVTIELSEDRTYAVVKARLRRETSAMAAEGSVFWVVRPDVRLGDISRLSTIITGPYIEVLPGSGKPRSEFIGLDSPPPIPERGGLRIILATSHLGSVRPGSPVYYRGIQVGSVTSTSLSRDATAVHVHGVIMRPYARLVRIGSRFWTVGGLDVNVSVLRGVEVNVESLRALVTGGIAFATPEDPSSLPAKEGTIFPLHDKPRKEWLQWTPKILTDASMAPGTVSAARDGICWTRCPTR
jgi:paraquat-inducible protein B